MSSNALLVTKVCIECGTSDPKRFDKDEKHLCKKHLKEILKEGQQIIKQRMSF
jgi:hypothetical protein